MTVTDKPKSTESPPTPTFSVEGWLNRSVAFTIFCLLFSIAVMGADADHALLAGTGLVGTLTGAALTIGLLVYDGAE